MGSTKREGGTAADGSSAGSRSRAGWIVLGLVIVAAAAAGVWYFTRPAPASEVAPAEASTPATVSKADHDAMATVLGRWRRPDGGYVVEIQRLEDDGTLQVAYYNPNPIHVAQARAYREQGQTLVFIELQDVGYPGATYLLAYLEEHDVLAGRYTQPAAKETFDVYFERLR